MKNITSRISKLIATMMGLLMLAMTNAAFAAPGDVDKPLLVIGASYSDGRLPFNDALLAPLFGISVGMGSYLSLGDALIKDPRLPGYVINEAQAGATTFERPDCNPIQGCNAGLWQGYGTQLSKATARVTLPGTNTVLAKYVVITTANDCLHSNAFGIPQDLSSPCTQSEMNAYVDRLIAVGQQALNAGLTPIYDVAPAYTDLDLPLAAKLFGLIWIADSVSYNAMRDLRIARIPAELPGAVVLDMWASFQHMGDGLHPNDKTARKAAAIIAQYIILH
ncbi:MAG: hypothetical protein R8K20_02240 [Gallionellaceae bacterium]